MIDSMLGALNLIALVATFAAGLGTFAFLRGHKWHEWASGSVSVLAFVAVTLIWLVFYRAIGFPGWMRWPTQLFESVSQPWPSQSVQTQPASAGDVFVKPDYYSINHKGWQHNTTPAGDVFTCYSCGAQFQVQLDYGPELPADATYRSNKDFLATLSTEAAQKDFADSLIRRAIPLQSGFTISIGRIGLSMIGGLDVLQFSAVVEMPGTISHDNSMVGIHKNRMMKLTLNYFDGAMNEQASAAINDLYSSLRFF
ncbi:MAG: hypothetical protein HZB57_09270 [Gammaproteobacteria bacterium]|nr:hypothetical protein [Gammaproteobacteria bacterium]